MAGQHGATESGPSPTRSPRGSVFQPHREPPSLGLVVTLSPSSQGTGLGYALCDTVPSRAWTPLLQTTYFSRVWGPAARSFFWNLPLPWASSRHMGRQTWT